MSEDGNSFYIDDDYCIGSMCLHNNTTECFHVVLNKKSLEIWNIHKIRQELGYKIKENEHFYTNKISKSVSGKELELYKMFYHYKF